MTQPTRVRRPSLPDPNPKQPELPPEPDELDDGAEAAVGVADAQADFEAAPKLTPRVEVEAGGAPRGPVPPGFVPRDGDVLIVSYGEVTLPLPRQFAMMRFGGSSYTRRLVAGDDVDETAGAISSWLTRVVERDGGARYRRLVAQFMPKQGSSKTQAPKPEPEKPEGGA